MAPTKRKGDTILFRATEAERKKFARDAKASGKRLSEWIRTELTCAEFWHSMWLQLDDDLQSRWSEEIGAEAAAKVRRRMKQLQGK